MTRAPILAGVVGWPIEQSLSPLIHTIWAHRAGVKGYYMPFAIPPTYEDFCAAMESFKTLGFAGVNVTLPHKENALRYGAKKSASAEKAGAANMISFTDDGSYADNSDIVGFANAVESAAHFKKSGHALILGAGGAARGPRRR